MIRQRWIEFVVWAELKLCKNGWLPCRMCRDTVELWMTGQL